MLSPLAIIALLSVAVLGMGVGCVFLLRDQTRQERLQLRINRAMNKSRRRGPAPVVQVPTGVGRAVEREGMDKRLSNLFGFDQALSSHYAVRWWIALIVTLAIAVTASKIATGLVGRIGWLGVPVVWVLLSRMFFGWCEQRRRDRLFVQFPDALAMIVRAVRVGIPVTDAIRAVGREMEAPTGPEFARLSHELAIGAVLQDALTAMSDRNGLQEYRFFATAVSLQTQTGGGLSETLENLADVIRKRVAVRQKGHALSAEAKMSSWVLASLPPLAAGGLWIVNGAYISLLFSDPLGRKILAGAVVALTSGIVTMNVMIRKSLS